MDLIKKKICKRCNKELPYTSYYKNKRRKDGIQTYCKLCMKKENQINYKKHKESWDNRTKKYCKTDSSKKYRREWAKKKYDTNPEYRKKCIKNAVDYERKKLKSDIEFKIKHTLKNRLRKSLKTKNIKKCYKTNDLIGCSISYLKKYLEDQFDENMNWDNHGEWHIDHHIPIASFNLLKEEEQKKCFHYTNLKPLWAKDNLSKGKKVPKKKIYLTNGVSCVHDWINCGNRVHNKNNGKGKYEALKCSKCNKFQRRYIKKKSKMEKNKHKIY